MESMASRFVVQSGENITPYFDELSKEGLLFTNFFRMNYTSSTICNNGLLPNLPGFEYLMQTPEGVMNFQDCPHY